MNIIELQDNLKDLPDRRLIQEMQTPTGNMPQFLVLSELTRRKRMRDDYNRQDAANMPTVAEEVMTAAGVPQGGITAIARNMAPNSSIAQNTSADMAVQREPTRAPQMMADGGILNLFKGGRTREDMYTQVEPYPENDSDFRKRRDWNLRYGMTHNLDGSPKRMSPSTVDFDAMSDDILDAEQNRIIQQEVIDNNIPELGSDQPLSGIPVVPSQVDPETNLDISAALGIGSLGTNLADAMNNPIGDLPFLPPPTRDTREPSSPTDATIGSYGRTTVGQTKDEIARMNEVLNTAGIGPDTESDVDMLDLMAQAQIEREGFGAGQTDDTSGIVATSRRSDREKKGFFDFLPTVGSTGEGRGRGYQVTVGDPLEIPENIEELMPPINQETEDRQVRRQETTDLREPTDLPDERRDNDPDISEFLTSSLGQTTGTGLSLEGGVESLLPPSLTGSDTGGGASSTVGDSYSTLEGRIAKMLADREKSAESDKYLALAQAGLALMASDSPTLGGAIGEAGLVGISQMREARNQYDKDILGLLGTQADIDAARRDASLSERQFGLKERELKLLEAEAALPPGLSASERNAFLRESGDLFSELNSLNTIIESGIRQGEYGPETISEAEKNALIKERNALQSQYNKFIGLVNPNLANIQTAE